MLRLFFAGAIALGSAGMVVLTATPASALPVCTAEGVTGVAGNYAVGPICVPYPLATECNSTSTGLGTLIHVTEDTCVPAL
ncbi:MAG TPA: hypothetical protein VH274_07310 [Mycobacteriales bacterium]|jgi:hypothetical protein|nr:hypothetical protein [Mycobacteriales bacterium]